MYSLSLTILKNLEINDMSKTLIAQVPCSILEKFELCKQRNPVDLQY